MSASHFPPSAPPQVAGRLSTVAPPYGQAGEGPAGATEGGCHQRERAVRDALTIEVRRGWAFPLESLFHVVSGLPRCIPSQPDPRRLSGLSRAGPE